ncbi:MAG TPA: hypothetical protein VIZ28_10935, partial [Chitinophagaceae bacterium]
MKHISILALAIIMISAMPVIALAQADTTRAKKPADSLSLKNVADSATKVIVDTVAIKDTIAVKKADTMSIVATPMNCYKQWLDVFAERGVKPITDGMQEVVI